MVEVAPPVTKHCVESGKWEIEIDGKRFAANASIRPLYDPQMKRIKI
jgi:4-methylaminobutanoate oxidase (formaldehyde-forming)